MNDADKVKELEAKLAEVSGKLEAMAKREFDYERREEERKRKGAALDIALGVEFMDARIAADTDPRWLKFREVTERAMGDGWFAALFDRSSAAAKSSPAEWLKAIEKALQVRTAIGEQPGRNFRELYAEIGQWLDTTATQGFRAARTTGEF